MNILCKDFCAAVEAANSRLSLLSSDSYLKSQWQFIDHEDATELRGATAALSTYLIVDSNITFYDIAPIVRDLETGELFADLSKVIRVFPDELHCV